MDYIKLKLKDKSAQDMIEFTFVLPLLIFCFVFVLTGGQLIYNKFVAFNAVYNGLRQASLESSDDIAKKRLKQIADEYLPQTISVARSEVELTATTGNDLLDGLIGSYLTDRWNKDTAIQGTVTYVVNTIFPFRFNFRSDFNGQSSNTEFLAPNQMRVSATTSAFVEYNNRNSYSGTRVR